MADHKRDAMQMRDFIRAETEKLRRSARLTWAIGLVVTVLVGCYMSGLVILVKGMLEPMTAARMLAMSVEDALPSILQETERSLRDQAVPLANSVSQSVFAYMPRLRLEAQKQIDLTYQEFLPLLREEIRTNLQEYMKEHGQEISDFYGEHKAEEFPPAFVDAIVEDLVADLSRRLSQDSGGKGLEYIHGATVEMMRDMNSELTRLLNLRTDQMSRSDRLQRRLIVAWVQALDEVMQKRAQMASPAPVP
jgi:hypothetical protein